MAKVTDPAGETPADVLGKPSPEGQVLDLDDLDTTAWAEEGAWLDLKHPATNAPTGMRLHLKGKDSEAYETAVAAMIERSARTAILESSNSGRPADREKQADEVCTVLAAITMAWEGIVWGGKALPFSRANAYKMYRKFKWIREQAETFLQRRASFFNASVGS
jgi:hypothetical protein